MLPLLLKISALFPVVVMLATVFFIKLRLHRYSSAGWFSAVMPLEKHMPVQTMQQCDACGVYCLSSCDNACDCAAQQPLSIAA